MNALIDQLNAQAKRLGIQKKVRFFPVKNRDDLVVWADDDPIAFKAANLLVDFLAFQLDDNYDAEDNYDLMVFETRNLKTFEVETDATNAYVLSGKSRSKTFASQFGKS